MKKGARSMLLFLGDIQMLVTAFFIMLKLAFWGEEGTIGSHSWPFTIVSLVWIFIFFLFNLYETESIKPTIPRLKIIGIASIVALTVSALLFYSVPSFGITPKTNLLIFGAVFVGLFIVWRRFFYGIFAIYFQREVSFLIDSGQDNVYVNDLVNYIKTYPQSGFVVSGTYTSIEALQENRGSRQIDTLIVSKNALKGENLKQVYNSANNILNLAYAYEDILGKVPVDSIDESWFLHNIRGKNNFPYEVLTKILNFILAFIILTIASPFLIITAIAIKLYDGGPVFYNQNRVGRNGENFKLHKFRSMIVNADKNEAGWTEKNDPRITKVGRIIRKLHLDEFPQFINILRGEMSLVGPRPEIPLFAEKLEREIPHYNLRHIITPGFTGWAQIKFRNARGIAESKEKFEYDLYYIKNRNIFMDIGIILRTIVIIFTHD